MRLKLFAISVLAAFVLLASISSPHTGRARAAASPVSCGVETDGHSIPGNSQSTYCPEDGKPIFPPDSHTFNPGQLDHCPYDGQPLTNGHTVPGH